MAILSIPDSQTTISDPTDIKKFLNDRGVFFEQWSADENIDEEATQEEILAAYQAPLNELMEANGYATADVIRMLPNMENYPAVRAKFLDEHTHSEDEVRFFVEGEGRFWFNLDGQEVFNVLCQAGDLISVPAGTRHWFDAGASEPRVTAIRIFTDETGWVPDYTGSGISKKYIEQNAS